jgi:hypothetical protein
MESINEGICWHGTSWISSCLNRLLHVVLGCVPAIILMIFFLVKCRFSTVGGVTPFHDLCNKKPLSISVNPFPWKLSVWEVLKWTAVWKCRGIWCSTPLQYSSSIISTRNFYNMSRYTAPFRMHLAKKKGFNTFGTDKTKKPLNFSHWCALLLPIFPMFCWLMCLYR